MFYYLNIEFSGIFEIKINHIINIIHLLLKKEKKGVKEYDNCCEKSPKILKRICKINFWNKRLRKEGK